MCGRAWSELHAHKARRTWWLSTPSPRAQLQTARRERFETGRAQAEKRELRQSLEPTLWLARWSSPPTRISSSPPLPAFLFPFFFSRHRCQRHPDHLLVTPWPRTPTSGRKERWVETDEAHTAARPKRGFRARAGALLSGVKTFFFRLIFVLSGCVT